MSSRRLRNRSRSSRLLLQRCVIIFVFLKWYLTPWKVICNLTPIDANRNHVHPHTSTYIHTYPHASTYIHIHPHASTYIHIHPHTSTHTSTHTHIHAFTIHIQWSKIFKNKRNAVLQRTVPGATSHGVKCPSYTAPVIEIRTDRQETKHRGSLFMTLGVPHFSPLSRNGPMIFENTESDKNVRKCPLYCQTIKPINCLGVRSLPLAMI